MSDARVLERLKNEFVPVLVHRDREPKWAREHNVTGVPVVHFTDAEGEVMSTLIGQDAADVLEEMDTCVAFIAEFAEDDAGAGDSDDMDDDDSDDSDDMGD